MTYILIQSYICKKIYHSHHKPVNASHMGASRPANYGTFERVKCQLNLTSFS